MKFISNRIGISINTISLWLRGNHHLKEKNILKLKELLRIIKPAIDLKF
jgi:transcriptional regulator with XRE-family HTH domain